MFPRLVNIEINISRTRSTPLPAWMQQLIQDARNVLHEGPDVGGAEKSVKLIFRDGVKRIKVV